MEALGGIGAASLIALENLFPPLPSEIILPLAGFTAGTGASFTVLEAILWCTGGSVFGAWLLYGLGALLGRDRTRRILTALPLMKAADVYRTEVWFEKYGQWTVFFGRMIPIFRSLISLPAGVTRMSPVLFTALTATGSLIWNSVLIYAGYLLGANWHVVETYVGTLSKVVIVVVVIAAIVWIALRIRNNRAMVARAEHSTPGHLAQIEAEPRDTPHAQTPHTEQENPND
ncbi:DedA family protein [Changpingibacter yushuensis]|uniref:DedA family protein n=1 Tax=Changpingibacter yushuensis TaxID=2758440 RepID=UPI0015F60CA1|nr:DedA family protein [Changpingibacter yushuensis]